LLPIFSAVAKNHYAARRNNEKRKKKKRARHGRFQYNATMAPFFAFLR
jgi:hypothetical protein